MCEAFRHTDSVQDLSIYVFMLLGVKPTSLKISDTARYHLLEVRPESAVQVIGHLSYANMC